MENASKALLIAGGILISIIIIMLIIYVISTMGDLTKSQDEKALAQQTAEFNKGFLAYNKTRMYGIDVISVVNKAIDYNTTMDLAKSDDPYYINIIIKTKTEFKTTGKKINTALSSNDPNHEQDMSSSELSNKVSKSTTTFSLPQGTYQLGNWSSDGTLQMNNGIIGFFEQSKNDETISEGNYTFYIYSALTNFKRAVFKCTDITGDDKSIEYSDSGRIKSMEFEQIQ